jgi:glycine betaine/proline transport system permease protein
MDWLAEHKVPLGRWIAALVDFINDHASGALNAVSDGIEAAVEGLVDGLLWLHPLAAIALFAGGVALLHRTWRLPAAVVAASLLIINLGYWRETIETLALVLLATTSCMVVGVPLGIAAAHRPRFYAVLRPMLDLMQTIPTFVYLIPTLMLFGLGVVPGLVSTIVFALPAPIRLTHLGIISVPRQLVECADSFGASRWQRLVKVELPLAAPSIRAGLTQCIMLSLSMVVIAALVGADGLGEPVVRALNTVNIAMGFEAGLAIVILAILLDRIVRVPDRRTRDRRKAGR